MAKRYEIQDIGSGILLVQPQREKASGGFGPQFEVDGQTVGFVQENYGRFIAYKDDERLQPKTDVRSALNDLGVGPNSLFFRSNIIYDYNDQALGRIRRRGQLWYVLRDGRESQEFNSDAEALHALLDELCFEITEREQATTSVNAHDASNAQILGVVA